MSERRPVVPAPSARESLAELVPDQPVVVESRSLLRTARMVLRPLCASDREEFLRVVLAGREHLAQFSPLHRPGESDDALFERQLMLTEEGDRTGNAWRRVGMLDDGSIAGAFNLNSIRRGLSLEADANWWVAPHRTRQGLGVEGVRAMLDYAFMELPAGLGLHRVFAGVQPGNEASLRLAERVGFRRAAGDVSSYLHAGGRWERHSIYVAEAIGPVAEPIG